jgi:hypothetical protein
MTEGKRQRGDCLGFSRPGLDGQGAAGEPGAGRQGIELAEGSDALPIGTQKAAARRLSRLACTGMGACNMLTGRCKNRDKDLPARVTAFYNSSGDGVPRKCHRG